MQRSYIPCAYLDIFRVPVLICKFSQPLHENKKMMELPLVIQRDSNVVEQMEKFLKSHRYMDILCLFLSLPKKGSEDCRTLRLIVFCADFRGLTWKVSKALGHISMGPYSFSQWQKNLQPLVLMLHVLSALGEFSQLVQYQRQTQMISHTLPHIEKATQYSQSIGIASRLHRNVLKFSELLVRMAESCDQTKFLLQLRRVPLCPQFASKIPRVLRKERISLSTSCRK